MGTPSRLSGIESQDSLEVFMEPLEASSVCRHLTFSGNSPVNALGAPCHDGTGTLSWTSGLSVLPTSCATPSTCWSPSMSMNGCDALLPDMHSYSSLASTFTATGLDSLGLWDLRTTLSLASLQSDAATDAPLAAMRQTLSLESGLDVKEMPHPLPTSAVMAPSTLRDQVAAFGLPGSVHTDRRPMEGAEPELGVAPPPGLAPTLGSMRHGQGCKPCVYFHRGRCPFGFACKCCHLAHHQREVMKIRPGKLTRQRLSGLTSPSLG